MKNSIYLIIFAAFLFSSCDNNGPITPDIRTDFSDVLSNLGNNVIVSTYADLKKGATTLAESSILLAQDPTETNLLATRQAWMEARIPWEQSEGFLLGPADAEGLRNSIDSWPVNVNDLNNILNSTINITDEYLKTQGKALKGFHVMEYLLWGESGNKSIVDFKPREYEYLAEAAVILSADIATLTNQWLPDEGNYVQFLLTVGNNNIFASQKSAIEKIVEGLVIIANEVANIKINDPLSTQDLTLEESRYSSNSKADFINNMYSIQNIFKGQYAGEGNGKGISTIIVSKDAELNTKIRELIEQTILKIEVIPGTFSEAIFADPQSITEVQRSVNNLRGLLQTDVGAVISKL